jgi:hypothetical protein
MRAAAIIAVAMCAICAWAGCAPQQKQVQADSPSARKTPRESSPAPPTGSDESSYLRFEFQELGEIPNSGLLLPAVSPDGRWIAYLAVDEGHEEIDPSAVLSGSGLEHVAVRVRRTDERAAADIVVSASNSAWPTWSPNGQDLLFAAYGSAEGCRLVVHNVETGATREVRAGLARVTMPAFSASGRKVAVVGSTSRSTVDQLFVVDLETQIVETVPSPPELLVSWPCWVDDDRLIFVAANPAGAAHLYQWNIGQAQPYLLCRLNDRWGAEETVPTLMSLGSPLSPDGRQWAFYDAVADRVALVDLDTRGMRELKPQTRAGCWLDASHFLVGTDEALWLYGVRDNRYQRMIRGAWLPRAAFNSGGAGVILCGRADDPRKFTLRRLKMLSGE